MTRRNRRGGARSRPSRGQTRPVRSPHRDHGGRADGDNLLPRLRRSLRSREPRDFLDMVSGLMTLADPRARNPFASKGPVVTLDTLVESLIDIPVAETTAALTAIRTMTTDEAIATRIAWALLERRHPLPDWLTRLGETVAEPEALVRKDVLGDDDDYVIAARLPSGHSIAAVVNVDHNLSTAVSDGLTAAQSLAETEEAARESLPDDETLTRVDPATARAVVEAAIEQGVRCFPPLESDTWPASRPLVEWLLRLLPPAVSLPEPHEWTAAELREISDAFFASTFASALDRRQVGDLLDDVLWFASGFGSGDPYRWSPSRVEELLRDWYPRKVIGEAAHLARMPEVLRDYIGFCHHLRGIGGKPSAATLATVDACEPAFQRQIRSARLQGAQALVDQLSRSSRGEDTHDRDVHRSMLERLQRQVGGLPQLLGLDDTPLPDEAFEWAGIPDDIRPVLLVYLSEIDRVADELLDVEHRTAMRRFLGRAAVADPAVFRRRGVTARGAAAVAWVICKANGTVGESGSPLSVQDLLAAFGVKGSVAQRAEPLLRANGVDPYLHHGRMDLGSPDLLTAARRRQIIVSRDRYLALGGP